MIDDYKERVFPPRITARKPITWVFRKPASFPCFICEEREATWSATVEAEKGRLNMVACEECLARNNAEEIWEHFFGGTSQAKGGG